MSQWTSISVPRVTAILTGAVAFVTLAGWLFNLPLLASVSPSLVTMKANTALAFILLSGSLYSAASTGYRKLQPWLALLTATISSLTLSEYAFRTTLGIDELLVKDYGRSMYPGRMAPITAINFLLLAAALMPMKFKWADHLREALASLAALCSTFAIVGYLYGIPVLYGAVSYSSSAMALHTGISFLMVAVGALSIRREAGFMWVLRGPSIGAMVARYLIPAAVIVPFALGAIFIRSNLHRGHLELAMALSVVSSMVLLGILIWCFSYMIQHLEKQKAAVQLQAETDSLTGIYNRRHFDSAVGHEMNRARRYSTSLSLIFFDVDHFKDFNDRHGHGAGDRVLQYIARECDHNLRDTDCLCRYGGEEFAVIAPNTPVAAAMLLARRIRESISGGHVDDIPEQVTISSGIACSDHSLYTVSDLCAAADEALYRAKRSGRNCERSYSGQPRSSGTPKTLPQAQGK